MLEKTGRPKEADAVYRRALAIDEKDLGSDHPDTAADLSNLAVLLLATGRLAEAEPLLRRALAIDERWLGPDDPSVAFDLNNLAVLLRAMNQPEEAEALLRRALAIDEKGLGPDHPAVARDLVNLAVLLQTGGRLTEAEALVRRAGHRRADLWTGSPQRRPGPGPPGVVTRGRESSRRGRGAGPQTTISGWWTWRAGRVNLTRAGRGIGPMPARFSRRRGELA